MSSVLSPSEFLDRLRMEKRRADRSGSPLSVVVFRFNGEGPSDNRPMSEFLSNLRRATRETDLKGFLGADAIGLMLLDTDAKGREQCLKKVLNGGLPFCKVEAATYPDEIFEALLSEKEPGAEEVPLHLDDLSRPKKVQKVLKRTMDLLGAMVALILASPIMLFTALAVKLTSPGPVIFKQIRLGEKGNRFNFYKFRSMYYNTDDRIHREYVEKLIKGEHDKLNQGDPTKPLYKIRRDPRVTPVGRIIRKFSIDELPQLFNVLRGEMSLVGPRPPLPYEVEKYDSWHLRRILEVKPGITGLWQVAGRSRTSFDDMVRLDLRYAQSWSLWLDLKILLKTFGAVLFPQGAL